MGNLRIERLKPAPPWYSTSIDLFGPFTIRDEVKKRTTSKAYGVIFTCLATRAIGPGTRLQYREVFDGTEKICVIEGISM